MQGNRGASQSRESSVSRLYAVLNTASEAGATAVQLVAGRSIALEVSGEFLPLGDTELTVGDVFALASILGDRSTTTEGFVYRAPGIGDFRCALDIAEAAPRITLSRIATATTEAEPAVSVVHERC